MPFHLYALCMCVILIQTYMILHPVPHHNIVSHFNLFYVYYILFLLFNFCIILCLFILDCHFYHVLFYFCTHCMRIVPTDMHIIVSIYTNLLHLFKNPLHWTDNISV